MFIFLIFLLFLSLFGLVVTVVIGIFETWKPFVINVAILFLLIFTLMSPTTDVLKYETELNNVRTVYAGRYATCHYILIDENNDEYEQYADEYIIERDGNINKPIIKYYYKEAWYGLVGRKLVIILPDGYSMSD